MSDPEVPNGQPETPAQEPGTPDTGAAEAASEAPVTEPEAPVAELPVEPEPAPETEPESESEHAEGEASEAPVRPETAKTQEIEPPPELLAQSAGADATDVAKTADFAPLPEELPAEPAPKPKRSSAASADSAVEAAEDDEEQDTPFDKLVARAKRFSHDRVRTILESLLFVTDKPLTPDAIRACTGIEVEVIIEGLTKMQGTYRDGVRGIVLHEVAGGWQFRTCPTASEFVRRFLKVKPQRLTRAALETLAIIAYRQPVTRPEVEEIRAVDSGAVIKALLDRQLIKIIGKKEEPGRPLLYGTSPQFLEFFNLKDLASLPTLREFQELTEESREIVEKEAPAEQKGTAGLVADLRDSKLEERLMQSTAEADNALADLETAIADSDSRSKETARALNPVQPPGSPFGPRPDAAPADAPAGAPEPEEDDEDLPRPRGRPQDDDDEDDDDEPSPE